MGLALVIAAVVSVTLGSEAERLVATEVSRKSSGEAPHFSSGQEGNATKSSSSQKDMGQVRGRDIVTLQTCTPYPTFEERLIVRADRV